MDVLGKLGLVLLVVFFGAFAFVAGTQAPDSWRVPIMAFGHRLPGLDTPLADGRPAPRSGPVLAPAGDAAVAASASGVTPAPAASANGSVPLASVLVTARLAQPEPAKGAPAYALQLGQYVTDAEAQLAMRRAASLAPDLPQSRITALDATQQPWLLVTLGRFVSAQAASRAAPRLRQLLGVPDLPVIKLPPPATAVPPSGKASP